MVLVRFPEFLRLHRRPRLRGQSMSWTTTYTTLHAGDVHHPCHRASFGHVFSYPLWLSHTLCGFSSQIAYATILTISSTLVLPGFKEASGKLGLMNPLYISTFMPEDKIRVKVQRQYDDLIVSFFGIAIGWAWTAPAATECRDLDLSPTCPAVATVWTFFAFLIIVVMYVFVCGMFPDITSPNCMSHRCI